MYDQGAGDYGMHGAFGIMGPLFSIAIFVLFLWFYARIIGRAGFSPWWALITLVPIVNLVMLWIFAFGRWPVLEGPPDPGEQVQ